MTGVQTCALPISDAKHYMVYRADLDAQHEEIPRAEAVALGSLLAGAGFHEACVRVTALDETQDEAAVVHQVVAMLARWCELGLVTGIHLAQ